MTANVTDLSLHRRTQQAESEVARLKRENEHLRKLLKDAYESRDRYMRRVPLGLRLASAAASGLAGALRGWGSR